MENVGRMEVVFFKMFWHLMGDPYQFHNPEYETESRTARSA